MAESENPQHIQFGDDINPAKTPNSSYGYKQELAISEKPAGVDAEERALQIANADLNHKHKQVSSERDYEEAAKLTLHRPIQVGCSCGWRIKVRCKASLPSHITQTNQDDRYWCDLWGHWDQSPIRLQFHFRFATEPR
jgi:hypothetical protein